MIFEVMILFMSKVRPNVTHLRDTAAAEQSQKILCWPWRMKEGQLTQYLFKAMIQWAIIIALNQSFVVSNGGVATTVIELKYDGGPK